MEGETQGARPPPSTRWKKKRRWKRAPPFFRRPDDTFFPLMLASCAKIHSPGAGHILKQLLCNHLAFVRGGVGGASPLSLDQTLPPGLLSLLPLVLGQTHKMGIAVLAAEVVGAVALCSLDANEAIASDGETVRALVEALGNTSKRAATAACNAVLDLSVAPLGRERLMECHALGKLLSLFCQVATVPDSPVCSGSTYKESDDCFVMGFTKDIFQSSLLGAAIALVNSCNNEFLEQISGKVSRRFLFLVKEIWVRYSNQKGCLSASKHDLAETIFRLSMNQVNYMPYMPELIKRSMFGNDPSDFENFILNYWENSPFLLRNGSRNDGVIFNCLDFSSRTIDAAMDSILQSLVSCPHITSDELDILTFLDEVKGVLGSPMVYGQDIRVVKTQELLPGSTNENVKKEVHFFNCTSLTSVNGLAFTCNHIQNCKEAVQDGFTIALRGMEFRSKKIAGLSDGLAALFGQPLVGANVYLTPPNSQGLSRHYDDHCVFVCQLLGMKRWVVFPRSAPLLPRLYEPLDSLSPLEFAAKFSEGREFFLREGDILYIPRGCPHEAYTTVNERESQVEGSSFSLHLTLGIEVEPPFERC